jgi:carboxymethylenebutenolidase
MKGYTKLTVLLGMVLIMTAALALQAEAGNYKVTTETVTYYPDRGVQASVMYYGRFSPADDFSKMRALILGNFGEEDRAISVDSVREFQATLKTLNGNHEVYIYQNAGHAFANSDSPNYNEEAAERTLTRTLTFLEKHL